MSAAAKYGLLIGVVGGALFLADPRIVALLWFLLSLQLFAGAFVVWERMRLPYSTAAMLTGAAGLFLLGVWSLTGPRLVDRPWPELLTLAFLIAAAPIFFWLDSRRHPERWQAWGRALERSSLTDMLRFRHIPHL